MTHYRVIIEGREDGFTHDFDGEPQVNLTFEHDGTVYKVKTRAHDEAAAEPTIYAQAV